MRTHFPFFDLAENLAKAVIKAAMKKTDNASLPTSISRLTPNCLSTNYPKVRILSLKYDSNGSIRYDCLIEILDCFPSGVSDDFLLLLG